MLPLSFNNYFVDLNKIHKHYTRQKLVGGYYHHSLNSEFGRKRLHHVCLNEWESIPLAQKKCYFVKFKSNYKTVILEHYSKTLFKYIILLNCLFFFLKCSKYMYR